MSIDWWTLGLQAVNVLVLLWILSHFLFRPVSEIIARRQAAASKELDAARTARSEAEAALADAKAQIDGLSARRAGMLSDAQAEADKQKRLAMEEARREVDKLRAEARGDIARQRDAAEKTMRTDAAELAVDVAARLLDRLPAAARIDGFIDGLADAVGRLPERTRDAIGTDGPVQVRAATEMSGDEADRLAQRLQHVLGRAVTVAASTDPELIAGLELDAPHAVVRNHFRADLDKIRQEFLHDE